MTEERLPGGRVLGAVRVGDEVRRPAQPWTRSTHAVLRHLEAARFSGAPRALGFDERGRERLSFLPGETLGEQGPWPEWVRADDTLRQVGEWLRRLHDATESFRPAADAVWFTGRAWQPGLVIAHLDAAPWNAVWADGGLAGFVDWDTAGPSRREDDLAFSALTWVPLLTATIAEPAGFTDPADRRRRFHLLLDAYGYRGDRTTIREALLSRVERNVAVIRDLAGGPQPTLQHLLPWAADLERSGREAAALPASFWTDLTPATPPGGPASAPSSGAASSASPSAPSAPSAGSAGSAAGAGASASRSVGVASAGSSAGAASSASSSMDAASPGAVSADSGAVD